MKRSGSTLRTVDIVQPYVPSYRVPFFELLTNELIARGVALRIFAGTPDTAQAKRGDAQIPTWMRRVPAFRVGAFGRHVTLSTSYRHWRKSDAVIVPHMGSSVDAFAGSVLRSNRRLGLWGHIAPYTAPAHPLDTAIERWQLLRADHVFAYTPGGASYALDVGVPSSRVTTVMNSIDTTDLTANLAALSPPENQDLNPRFAYVGALDASKRVGFLSAALDIVWERAPHIQFDIGGAGAQSSILTDAESRGQVKLWGHVDSARKAEILSRARGIVSPGRIGLIAVDALASRRPLLTTNWPYHAPEFEYLKNGTSVFVSDDNPHAFATMITKFAQEPSAKADSQDWAFPTLQDMVSNFVMGVQKMLGDDRG